MDALAQALSDAGGVAAPRERSGQLRALLRAEVARSAHELGLPRTGYDVPVTVAFAPAAAALAAHAPSGTGGSGAPSGTGESGAPPATGDAATGATLYALVPVAPELRADPGAVGERAWELTAAAVGALVEAAEAGGASVRASPGPPVGVAGAGGLRAGEDLGALVLAVALGTGGGQDATEAAELAALAFDEHVAAVDRLRARALALPAGVIAPTDGLKPPIGVHHPLAIAALVAGLGGRPADPASVEAHEEAVLAALPTGAAGAARPHDDPDPQRRAARRILQRLDGMGKWGGYHTEFTHLARGFAPADRALAAQVGEALLAAGLLAEKRSVGQRHVFLDPRRAADIHALIDDGTVPARLALSAT